MTESTTPTPDKVVIDKDRATAVAVEYFTTTNKVSRDKVVNISTFGYSRLGAVPYSLKEIDEIFGTYKAFLIEVNTILKGRDKRIRSPRLVTGQFTQVEQLKRNAIKEEARRVAALEVSIDTLADKSDAYREEAAKLEEAASKLDDEIVILSSQLAGEGYEDED